MVYTEIMLSIISERAMTLLPKWILRRLYPPKKIEDQVKIDLRGSNPIGIAFGTDIPSISIYFTINNMSPADLILDRFLVDLWVSQPTMYGAVLQRYLIPKRAQSELYFTDLLTIPQQKQIEKHIEGQSIREIRIGIDAYFESQIGMIRVHKDLRCINVACEKPSTGSD